MATSLPRPKGQLADSADIQHAYRLLLGREPDPMGYEDFVRLVKDRHLTPIELAGFFLGSPEFATRHGQQSDPVEVKLDGYSMYVRPSDHDIGVWIMRGQTYEPHVTAMVRKLLQPGDTFVDVGANIGYFVALAAHLVGASGTVVAMEPMDKNVQLIYATMARNHFTQIEVFPYAASDGPGLLSMVTGSGTSNGGVVLNQPNDVMPKLFAQAIALDSVTARLPRIDLVKFDIEGHELFAWHGFKEALARHRPLVLTEFHPKCMRENCGIEPTDYLAILFDYGGEVDVLHHDGGHTICRDPESVLSVWRNEDANAHANGGMHLDLFIKPRA